MTLKLDYEHVSTEACALPSWQAGVRPTTVKSLAVVEHCCVMYADHHPLPPLLLQRPF